jgi:integrase
MLHATCEAPEPVPVIHHAAITEPHRVARLLQDICQYEGEETTRIALQLAPLLFVRPGELRKARWEEVDLQSSQWRIPAQRMKGRIQHIVPLSAQALGWLDRLNRLTGHTELMFPTKNNAKRCMSDNTLNKALRAMGYRHGQMTAHGFSTLASTLLSEHGWPEEVVERQLAHIDNNRVRAAYNHAQHLPMRAVMMQAWADYLDDLRANQLTSGALVFDRDAFARADNFDPSVQFNSLKSMIEARRAGGRTGTKFPRTRNVKQRRTLLKD